VKKAKKTKTKIGIWKRIKDVLDNRPWSSAFTYPIAFIILSVIVGTIFFTIGLENLGAFFVFIIYLTPLWVLFGLIVSKRRFPYLLSLIIGLGIPIFLSVVVYQGFTESAQRNATKTMHAQTIKYISAEIQKCKLGDSKFMNNNQDCPATALKTINGAVATMTDKNPFDTAKNSIRQSDSNTNDEDVGYVSLSASGSNIIIKTCSKTPCRKEENRLQAKISIEDIQSIINADAVELNCKYKAADKTVNLIIDRKNQSVKYDGRNYRILYILGDNIYFRSEHNYSDVVYNYSTNNLKGAFGLSLDEIKKNMNINTYNPVFANCYIKK
jgi:type IV pilus assembly protein PilA